MVGLSFHATEDTHAVHTKRGTQKPGCTRCSGSRLAVELRESTYLQHGHVNNTNAVVVASPTFGEFTWVCSKRRRAWSGVRERRRILRFTRINLLRWPRLRRSTEQLLRPQDVASAVMASVADQEQNPATPNPSIEGTSTSKLRLLAAAPHVKR